MIPIVQTEIEAGRGNCVAACLASILEIDIAGVPNFRVDADPWGAMQRWLCGRGLYAIRVPAKAECVYPLPQTWCILAGQSPREGKRHAVVGLASDRGWVTVHDPHPDGTGLLGEPEWVTFLGVLHPEKLSAVEKNSC